MLIIYLYYTFGTEKSYASFAELWAILFAAFLHLWVKFVFNILNYLTHVVKGGEGHIPFTSLSRTCYAKGT